MSNMVEITTRATRIGASGLSPEQANWLANVVAFLEQEIEPYVNLADGSIAATEQYFATLLNAASQEPLLSTLRAQPWTGAYAPAGLPTLLTGLIRQELDASFTPAVGESDWFNGFDKYFNGLANQGVISSGVVMQIGFASVRSVPHWIIGHQPQICFTLLLVGWFMPGVSDQERMAIQAVASVQQQTMAFLGQPNADLEQFLVDSPHSFIVFAGATFGFTTSDWEKLGDRIKGFLNTESVAAIKIAPLG